MRQMDWSLVRSVVCITMPTLAVFALSVRFLLRDIPQIVRDERARVRAETESVAKSLWADPTQADFVWERGRGIISGKCAMEAEFPPTLTWKAWGAVRTSKDNMWGWRQADGGRLVWARGRGEELDNVVYAIFAEIDERDYATTLYVFVPLFLAVLAAMTVFGVKYFIDYVRARDDFLVATAHDLTTPLASMRLLIGRNDVLARSLNERLIRLVANIRDFMRLGGRRPRPKPAPFDMVKAYGEAYSLFAFDYRDISGGRDVPLDASGLDGPGGRALALGDETIVVQILWNLLGNDLKYAAPYGPVRVSMSVDGGFVKVEFADEGRGMTQREMSRAFNRYYRARTALESGKGGFGIGLTTAREFAVSMGGSLSVRANSPKGCVFTLKLPLAGGKG